MSRRRKNISSKLFVLKLSTVTVRPSRILKVKVCRMGKDATCGPAAMRTLISFFGIQLPRNEANQLCGCHPEHGTHQNKISRALEKMGWVVNAGCKGGWHRLNYWVNRKKIPVIVDWFSVDDGHYAVVVAISKEYVWLADSEHCRVICLEWMNFLRSWLDYKRDIPYKKDFFVRWSLVAYPPDYFKK